MVRPKSLKQHSKVLSDRRLPSRTRPGEASSVAGDGGEYFKRASLGLLSNRACPTSQSISPLIYFFLDC